MGTSLECPPAGRMWLLALEFEIRENPGWKTQSLVFSKSLENLRAAITLCAAALVARLDSGNLSPDGTGGEAKNLSTLRLALPAGQ